MTDHKNKHIQIILVINHDPKCRKLLCWELGGEYPVLSSACTDYALRVAKQCSPDAILLDISSPHEDEGLFVLRELQSDIQTLDIPILIVTGSAIDQREDLVSDLLVAPHVGSTPTVLNKSILKEELHSKIRNIIKLHPAISKQYTEDTFVNNFANSGWHNQRKTKVS